MLDIKRSRFLLFVAGGWVEASDGRVLDGIVAAKLADHVPLSQRRRRQKAV